MPLRLAVVVLLCLAGSASVVHAHSMHREHMPVFCAAPTVTSVGNGAWSDPLTWSTRAVPGHNAAVAVAHEVVYDRVSDAALRCLRIDVPGRLRFATMADTRLTVVTLQVFGTLEVGTAAAPVQATAEIVIADAPIDTAVDPAQTGHGLLAVETSRIVMHGIPVPAAFTRLTREPKAGDTTLMVTSTAGWVVGDDLIVPDTRHLRREDRGIASTVKAGADTRGQVLAPRTEYVRIAAIQGNVVTLAAPLQWDHPGARDPDGKLERLGMVGHLSRNVVVRSANADGTRGHGFFMERANVDIRHTLWLGLGRTRVDPIDSATFDLSGHATKIGTNQLGRYPVHFHRVRGPWPANPDYQWKFIGNVVRDCLRWCVAIHDSHYGFFKNNVLVGDGVGQTGAGLVWEQGNEYKNTVEEIFIADVYGIARLVEHNRGRFLRDFGREGHGLWSNTAFSEFRNVHVFGVGSVGLFWNQAGQVTIPAFPGSDMTSMGATTKVTPDTVARTEGLEVGGAIIGFEPWQWFRGGLDNVVSRYTIWHAAHQAFKPAYVTAGGGITFEDLWIRGDVTALQDSREWPVAIGGNINYFTRGALVRADIQGMRVGVRPARGHTLVEGVTLRNYINLELIFNRIAAGTRIQGIPREYEYREFRQAHFRALGGSYPKAGPGPTHVHFPSASGASSGWSLEPHFNVFRDSCFDGTCYPALKAYFSSQDAKFRWPMTGLTNAESLAAYGVSAFLEIAPCAVSVVPAVLGRLCQGVTPVSDQAFKLSQISVEGGNKASQKPPENGLYTLIYEVCVESFEGECRGAGQEASRQWRVIEDQPTQLVTGRNWLTRMVNLADGRQARHSFVVDWGSVTTSPSEPIDFSAAVVSFTLINADTGEPVPGWDPIPLGSAEDPTKLNLASLPPRLNVIADVDPMDVGSVQFGLNANASYRTEGVAPFALAGDTPLADGSIRYNAWSVTPGDYTITATPWSGNGRGQAGDPLSLHLVIVRE